MRHHRLHRPETGRPRAHRRPAAPRVPRLRLGGRRRGPQRLDRDPAQRRASCRGSRTPSGPTRSTATTASGTRAGPRTAGRPRRTRTRTATAPAASSSSTTASSRTTSSSSTSCSARGTSSSPRPTPRSSRTSSSGRLKAAGGDGRRSKARRGARWRRLRGMFALVLMSGGRPATRSSPSATARRSSSASATASSSSPRTSPPSSRHTRDVVFLGDEEMAVLTRSGVAFTDFAGTHARPPTQRVLWDPIRPRRRATSTSCSRRSSSSRRRCATRSSAACRSRPGGCSSRR